jgi:hypothetical protein
LTQAAVEWNAAGILSGLGVGTYVPVCYGERTACGLERSSFLLTQGLEAEPFTEFVARRWLGLSVEDRRRIMESMASFIVRVHEAGISLPDLYVWHLFIGGGAGSWDFSVIDLHRIRLKVRTLAGHVRDLGAVDYSLLPKYFSEGDRRVLWEAYARERFDGDCGTLWRRVRRRSRVLAGRRRLPEY